MRMSTNVLKRIKNAAMRFYCNHRVQEFLGVFIGTVPICCLFGF